MQEWWDRWRCRHGIHAWKRTGEGRKHTTESITYGDKGSIFSDRRDKVLLQAKVRCTRCGAEDWQTDEIRTVTYHG